MSTMNLPSYWDRDLAMKVDGSVPRRISNSESSAYLQCERKWYYGYKLNLEPNSTSTALSRGIIGHDILATYYTVLKDEPGNFGKAENLAMQKLSEYGDQPGADDDMMVGLYSLIRRYFGLAKTDDWKILHVEEAFDIEVNEDFGYVMRLDLLAEIKGKNVLVDHKIVYMFSDQSQLDMNCQMPKYIGALRHNGIQVDYAILNQIRHRQKKGGNTDEETFERAIIRPSAVEVKNVMREQLKASRQIVNLHNLSDEDAESKVLRTMNNMTCKNCSFSKVCKNELMGQDVTGILATEFRQNQYNSGYNAEQADVDA